MRAHPIGAALLGAAMVVAAAPGLCAPSFSSVYTTHDYPNCRLVDREEDAETRECPGYAGIPVRWLGAADATSIAFGRQGASGDGLEADFTIARDRVEWRGPAVAGVVRPVAAIVRLDILRAIGGPVLGSKLLVYKLDGSRRSCIVAVIDGKTPDAHNRARAAADLYARAFRCGTDARKDLG